MPPAAGRKPGSTTDSEAYTVREDDILFVIARARRLTEQVCRELTQQSGLRLVELDILYYLSRGHAGDTARDIIGAKHLSKAHISKSVDNLRRTGCVTLREDAADRRCLHLCLTDKGRSMPPGLPGSCAPWAGSCWRASRRRNEGRSIPPCKRYAATWRRQPRTPDRPTRAARRKSNEIDRD